MVTISKRTADERKKAGRSAWDQRFVVASCLTERKLDEASNPLIIPGGLFAHRSIQGNKKIVVVVGLRISFRVTLHELSRTRFRHDHRASNELFINPLGFDPDG